MSADEIAKRYPFPLEEVQAVWDAIGGNAKDTELIVAFAARNPQLGGPIRVLHILRGIARVLPDVAGSYVLP